jgi:hypothetical protein
MSDFMVLLAFAKGERLRVDKLAGYVGELPTEGRLK